MTTRNQQKKALRNATNTKASSPNRTKKKTTEAKSSKPKLTEEEWRGHVLSYYQIEQKKSISSFLEERRITQRSIFVNRWKKSGLDELKKRSVSYKDASLQYDHWLSNWKEQLAKTKRRNGAKAFQIFVDPANEVDREVSANRNNDEEIGRRNIDCNNENIDSEEANTNSNGQVEDDSSGEDNGGDGDPSDTETIANKDKGRKKKLSRDEMKTLLTEIYLQDESISKFLQRRNLLRNKNAVYHHWGSSGLSQMQAARESLSVAMLQYDRWALNLKENHDLARRKNGSIEKAIPHALETFMNELIKQLALCGQGIGKKVATRVFEEAMSEWGVNSISNSTVNRFVTRFDLECRVLKNIDPARIAQVTPANRDAFFFRLNQVVALLHDLDPINCPWSDWKSVDSKFIDNVDEMGSDNTQHRDVLLIPKTVTQRLFQSTPEGDKANRHVTVVVFSKSNGWYKDDAAGIDGAPPPMIIHSKPSSKDKGLSSMEKRMQLYDADANDDVHVDQSYLDGISERNPIGFTVRTTNNGSMTKEIFLDMACHYVRHLGPEQGQQGKFTFLLTDSHVSRWHPKALYVLMKNRVIPLFFPSHLSIVVQPQDNGVILFLHKCIEDTALTERLFRSSTDIAYINTVLEKAFVLFRDTERKKLMDRGSNSTTRSYRITGMKPCNPFSSGWRENLELYASFNGLRMDKKQPQYYGVRPKNRGVCPDFSEADVDLLNEAVPLLAKESADDISILDDPKTKCYAVANEIIANWVEKSYDERTIRPRATTAVEKLALKHMDITHIVDCEPVSDDALLLLDLHHTEKKRQAILGQTKANECIQVRRKDSNESPRMWSTAIKMLTPENMWHVFDGLDSKRISTTELDEDWEVNLAFDMFPSDKRLREARSRAGRRRREEKDRMLRIMAESIAEEERIGELKEAFDQFMNRPQADQSFESFEESIVRKIERPSDHVVTVNFGSEEHTIKVCAHGNNVSSMSRLVMENICKTLVGVATRSERKSSTSGRRKGGKVASVKRGSDGFQKILQIDEQHQRDLSRRLEDNERTQNAKVLICRRRLKEFRNIRSLQSYDSIWNPDNKLLDPKQLTKPRLVAILKIYNVEGRTKLSLKPRSIIETKLDGMSITQPSFEKMEQEFLDELIELGGGDDPQGNQSFDSSVDYETDDSISIGEHGQATSVLLESETSGDDGIDIASSSSSDDTDCDSDNDRKTVTFNDEPTIHHIPRKSPPQSRRCQRKSTTQTTKRKTPADATKATAPTPTPTPTTTTTTTRKSSRLGSRPRKKYTN